MAFIWSPKALAKPVSPRRLPSLFKAAAHWVLRNHPLSCFGMSWLIAASRSGCFKPLRWIVHSLVSATQGRPVQNCKTVTGDPLLPDLLAMQDGSTKRDDLWHDRLVVGQFLEELVVTDGHCCVGTGKSTTLRAHSASSKCKTTSWILIQSPCSWISPIQNHGSLVRNLTQRGCWAFSPPPDPLWRPRTCLVGLLKDSLCAEATGFLKTMKFRKPEMSS